MAFGICNQTKLVRSKFFIKSKFLYKLVYNNITKNRDPLPFLAMPGLWVHMGSAHWAPDHSLMQPTFTKLYNL